MNRELLLLIKYYKKLSFLFNFQLKRENLKKIFTTKKHIETKIMLTTIITSDIKYNWREKQIHMNNVNNTESLKKHIVVFKQKKLLKHFNQVKYNDISFFTWK